MSIKHIICNILACLSVMVMTYAQPKADNIGNMVISAVTEYDEGWYVEAAAILDRAIALDPSSDAAWYYRAMCALGMKDADRAEKCFLKALDIDPGNYWYRYRLAMLYRMTSRPELTMDIYEKLLSDFPKKSELYFDLAELYSAQGENEKALATLKEIETVFGMSESIAVYRFSLLMRMNRQEEAYRSLEEYNSRYSSPYILSTLAEHQLSMYKDSTALAYYDEALDIAPDYAPAMLGKAETFRMTRRYDEYFTVLEDFVTSSSGDAAGKTDYLSAVIKRSDPKFLRAFMPRMDEIMDKTLQTHPTDSNALSLAGVYYYSTGRRQEAKGWLKKNMEVNPQSLSAAAGYVEFLMMSEDWAELSKEGRSAYRHFPAEVAFLEMASIGDYNLKDYDKVLELCDQILQAVPADSSKTLRAWSTKGDVYHQKGEAKKAYKSYENALKINPDYSYVLNNYAYYLSMEGKSLKKACEMSRKTIEAEPDNPTYLDTYGWILFLMGKPEEAKPHFKHAMLYGGKESAVILDHYAEVLFALGEYDRAMVYWNQALKKNDGQIPDLEERVKNRRQSKK